MGKIRHAIIALAIAASSSSFAAAPPADKAAQEKAWQAVQTCQFAIMASMHDPKSAEFPGVSRSYRELKNGIYTTQVQVRGRNAFNALRLATYECRVSEKTGKLISIKQVQ